MPQKEVYIKTYQKAKTNTNSLTFDGVNDYVTFANSGNLNLGTNNFTISAWVYPTSYSAERTIISRRGTRGFQLFLTTAGLVIMSNIGVANYTSTSAVPLNTWTQVTVTVSSGNLISFYFNGVLVNSVSGSSFLD